MCCASVVARYLAGALLALFLAACGGGGASSSTPAPTPSPITPPAPNVVTVSVDAGPMGTGYNVNRPYVQLTLCRPTSGDCQTIDHVLLDTGSVGLRLLSSTLKPSLSLERLKASSGLPLLSCVQFVDNTFAWGPLVSADVVLGGKTATSVPIQLIADPSTGSPPTTCSAGGTAMTTAAELGANGILGVGVFKEDCGAACAITTHNGFYYTCASASCTSSVGTKASLAQQLKNLVPLFGSDNNGVLLELPAVGSTVMSALTGSLTFGIGTRTNNQPGAVSTLTLDTLGYFTTVLGGQSMKNSFIDSGSNGLFFDSSAIVACSGDSAGFYCPVTRTTFSATLVGANRVSTQVSFSVDDATAMLNDPSKAVLPLLAGPMNDVTSFDWGLPFFYGRRVFLGMEGQVSPLGIGPYYAF
jgi:hypothetical protein